MPAPQSRSWLATLIVETSDGGVSEILQLPDLATGTRIEYVVGQLERAPTTGQLHWQFFVYTRKKLALGGVKSDIGAWLCDTPFVRPETVHLERCRGTIDQCVQYVTKDDSSVGFRFEYGSRPIVYKSGRDLMAAFRRGERIDTSNPAWDDVLLRFTRNRLEELRSCVFPRSRDPSVPFVCEVHYGVPDTGKSSAVFQSFPTAYSKPSGKWWCYYAGDAVVIMDDFDGSFIPFGDFKRWVDRYPCLVESKNGTLPLLATHWVITTNVWPTHWWSKDILGPDGGKAIWRRFSRVVVYKFNDNGGVDTKEWDPETLRATELFGLELQDPKGDKKHK